MSPRVRLALVALSLFLAAIPLALGKPGLPPNLKADESAYYLMARSLIADGDLLLAPEDTARAFDEFPFGPIQGLIVMSDDGWRTVYYGKPWLYSLLAVPLVAAFGANGMLLLNVLLMLAMVWMGFAHLRRYNPDGVAALFAAGFFVASAAFAYVWWLQPEVLNMAGVAAALFLGLRPAGSPGRGRRDLLFAALSGAALCAPVYNKPVFAALGLAILWGYLRGRRWRELAAWLLGAGLTMGALAGLGAALTGHPSSYLGVVRRSVTLCEPGQVPIGPELEVGEGDPERATGAAAPAAPSNAWSWLFHVPDIPLRELLENLAYFLWGRHTGLLLYLPFAALAVAYFFAWGRRDGTRWVLLGSTAVVALFFVVFVTPNWHGGGGFVGNRYFVTAYPAFLFLVTRISPLGPVLLGYLAGGLLFGPLLLTPFGAVGPEPTLQAHVRNFPYRLFPLELSLRHIPGYERLRSGELTLVGRRDAFLPRGAASFWVRGADSVEVVLLSPRPLGATAFLVDNAVDRNPVELWLEGARRELPPSPEPQRVVLEPPGPQRMRWLRHAEPLFVYRLRVSSPTGRIRPWEQQLPPNACPYFPRDESSRQGFFAGAGITLLGPAARLDQDVFALYWRGVTLPTRVAAGESFAVSARLANRSGSAWPADGAARVGLAYHWRTPAGEPVVWDGERTPLPNEVAPGTAVRVEMTVRAPEAPGTYVLELDPVFEHVAWFSERGVPPLRAEVEVTAGPAAAATPAAATPAAPAPAATAPAATPPPAR